MDRGEPLQAASAAARPLRDRRAALRVHGVLYGLPPPAGPRDGREDAPRGHEQKARGVLRPSRLLRLHAIFRSARAAELVGANPGEGAEEPKQPPFRPTLLEPAEVARVANAFELPQDRAVFLTLHLTGLRRFELQALRWRDVSLVEKTIRIADSKTETGRRLIAIPTALVDELTAQNRRTRFRGDDERVFCSPVGGPAATDRWRRRSGTSISPAPCSPRTRRS